MSTEQDQRLRIEGLRQYSRMFRSPAGLRRLMSHPAPGTAVLVALPGDLAHTMFDKLRVEHGGVGRIVIYTPGNEHLQVLDIQNQRRREPADERDPEALKIDPAITIGALIDSGNQLAELSSGQQLFTASDLQPA